MDKRVKHGMYGTRIYRIWSSMKNRCKNLGYHEYHLYGGRDITYCNEWEEFKAFQTWAEGSGYKETLTLDRINSDGNYEPSNCRWISMKAQCLNRRNNLMVEYKGECKPLKQWADELDINYRLLYKRIRILGWKPEEAFTVPSGGARWQG